MHKFWKFASLFAAAAVILPLVIALAALYHDARQDPVAFFDARRSRSYQVGTVNSQSREGFTVRSLSVQGNAEHGRTVRFWAYLCAPDSIPEPLPAFVLVGGMYTGRDAINVISDRPELARRAVFIALDYPYVEPEGRGVMDIVRHIPSGRQGLLDGVEAIRLAIDYLQGHPGVDPQRIVLLGVSLGAFYAVDAGGVDRRPAAVMAFMGGGDIQSLVDLNLRRGNHIQPAFLIP
ncbi:MAG: hypothetical protein C4524_02250, partial [Candidatus Zixiibacteriota bacterium]